MMSQQYISVIDPEELKAQIKDQVEAILLDKLPDSIRCAIKSKELNAGQVVDEFSISYGTQKALRDSGQIPFKRHGETYIYKRSDLMHWILENQVKKER